MNEYHSKSEGSVKLEISGTPKDMLPLDTHTALLAQIKLLNKQLAEGCLNKANMSQATRRGLEQVNENHEILARNHKVSIENLETRIGQLSRQIAVLPSSSGGFTVKTVDKPKNETCKVVETNFRLVTRKEEVEKIKKDKIKEKKVEIEMDENGNQGNDEERGFTLDYFINKNSPRKRTKDQIMNEPNPLLPNYIKLPYPIIKKRLVQEDEEGMFERFIKMLKQLQEVGESSEVPPKMNDPREFSITCTIGGVKISHALCDLGSSINVMSLSKFKELEIGEIVPNNMTLSLVDSFVTRPLGVVQDVIVHVDGLTFPAGFLVIDMKNDLEGSEILGRPFLASGKAKIDVETDELILKFNKEKVVFHAYQWTPYVEDIDTCYKLKEKGSEVSKNMKKGVFTGVRIASSNFIIE
ncbi:uncharacterized protein LOC127081603 [Lathyrus oleraceus]|uniref:uncharacterized protein LOC127081603 n=1 Tax=Pisum sativum TaxID=3888 RepID=UPI0021CFF8A0|nr:uncharacterized protein LOC127081603 [Pisum sativum]